MQIIHTLKGSYFKMTFNASSDTLNLILQLKDYSEARGHPPAAEQLLNGA